MQVMLFQRGEEEPVDIGERPRLVMRLRWFRIAHRQKRPVAGSRTRADLCRLSRVDGAGGHPTFQRGDLRSGKFAAGRHLQIDIDITHGPDEQAAVGIAGNDRRSRVAPGLPAAASIEHEAAFGLFCAVAVARVAPLTQDRQHLLCEKHFGRGSVGCRRGVLRLVSQTPGARQKRERG